MFATLEKVKRSLMKMPHASRATKVEGTTRWRAPEFSGRVVAELRKAAIANGLAWTHDKPRGVEKTVNRANKGHKFDREKPSRELKIEEALRKQPEIVAAFRARMKSKAKGLDKVWDDFILTKKERTLKIRMQDAQGGTK